jgi:uncharacterized protein YdhG (YjbR/CyaY superfamily)
MKTVTEYIAVQPPPVRKRLRDVRAVIRKAAPAAEEKISYGIPSYAHHGRLLYFAAHAEHIGVYPVTAALKRELGDALKPYLSKTAKSTIRLAHDEPLPLALLTKVVKVRVKENAEGPSRPSAKAKASVRARS